MLSHTDGFFLLRSSNQSNVLQRQLHNLLLKYTHISISPLFTKARSLKVTPTAPMGGGTQLYEGAHLTGAIRAFVANQAKAAIMGFLLLLLL